MKTQVGSTLEDRVKELNQMILQGQILEAFDRFYADDVTMQENEQTPTVGKAANRVNEEAFVGNISEFRNAAVRNVIVSDDLSVVEWDFDFTHTEWGTRNYRQLAVQRWNDKGQIVHEKFYYNN